MACRRNRLVQLIIYCPKADYNAACQKSGPFPNPFLLDYLHKIYHVDVHTATNAMKKTAIENGHPKKRVRQLRKIVDGLIKIFLRVGFSPGQPAKTFPQKIAPTEDAK